MSTAPLPRWLSTCDTSQSLAPDGAPEVVLGEGAHESGELLVLAAQCGDDGIGLRHP